MTIGVAGRLMRSRTSRRAAIVLAVLWGLSVGAALTVDRAAAGEFESEVETLTALAKDARYDDALARARAYAERLKAGGADAGADYARMLGWQAYLLQVQGRFSDAEPLFQKSAAILEKVLPAAHPDIATSLNNLGFQYQVTDRLDEAESLYKRALALREKARPQNMLLVADSLNNLAQVLKLQGRMAEADTLLRRALELRAKQLPPTHVLIAQSLANLSGVLEAEGRFRDAEPLIRRAEAIRQGLQGPDHPEVAGITAKLALNLSKQSRLDEAAAMFERALLLRARSQPADHVDIAGTLHDQALNLAALGRIGEARLAITRALAIRRAALPAKHSEIARTLADLARISARSGDRRRAGAEIIEALEILAARDRVDQTLRRQILATLDIAWEAVGADADDDARLQDMVLRAAQRASASPTATAVARMAARFAATNDALRQLIFERDDVQALQARLERDLIGQLGRSDPAGSTAADALRRQIAAADDRGDALDAQLKAQFPGYFSLVQPEALDVAALRRLLRPDEAALLWVPTPAGIQAWAVTSERLAWRKLDITTEEVTKAVALLRGQLDVDALAAQGVAAKLFDLGVSFDLYRRLAGPLEAVFADRKRLLIVANGPLTGLPFQFLIDRPPAIAQPKISELGSYRAAHWLVQSHALSVLPSIGSLVALRTVAGNSHAENELIGFGNPELGGRAVTPATKSRGPLPKAARTRAYASFWRGTLPDFEALRNELTALPETVGELQTVAHALGDERSRLLFGAAATETAVKTLPLAQYRVVYFATHGLVAGEVRGLGEPALVLTLPAVPSELDDGLLTASEVAQLHLDSDWVVLSACNTAAGDVPGADALSGLARAFFHAGARALLVSHWRVASDSAVKLTTAAFAAMAQDRTIGRAEALQRAMLAMIGDDKDPWGAYPAFWAPFSLVGEDK